MNNLYTNAIQIGIAKNIPIYLWFFSFSEIVTNKSYYNEFFSEEIIDLLMQSSGAMAFKTNYYYGIIVNNDHFHTFDDDTKNFIINHEFAHIMYDEFDLKKRKIIKNEHHADRFAKECGFRLNTSVFKLTKWEIFSLIPKCPYNDSRLFIWFYRIILFIKHFIKNIKRIYKNR